jgi:hypothetical protein
MQSGIADKHFGIGARSGVGLKNGRDVLAHGAKEADHGEVSILSSQRPVKTTWNRDRGNCSFLSHEPSASDGKSARAGTEDRKVK